MNVDNYIVRSDKGVRVLSIGKYDANTPNGFELYNKIYGSVPAYSDEGITMFKQWCEKYNVHFYARPRETFNPNEGIDEAICVGAAYVLMEDLS